MATKEVAKQAIGRVSVIGKGQYDAGTQYSPLDIVSFNGGSYLAKQASINHQPMLDSQDDYWQLIAAPGAGAAVVDDNDYLSWTGTESIVIESTTNEYTLSQSGSSIPDGGWSSTIPTLDSTSKGKYLWIRTKVTLNIGFFYTYSVSYQGLDGTGANTISVNNVSPINGNISLSASDIPTNGILNVQDSLDNLSNSVNNIIESIEVTNGRYIKYASGDMVCMKRISGISAPVTYTANNGLRVAYFNSSVSGFIDAAKWPQAFISKPYISVTSDSSSWNIIGYVVHDTTGITTIAVGRPDTGETVYLNLSCIAYGRWK